MVRNNSNTKWEYFPLIILFSLVFILLSSSAYATHSGGGSYYTDYRSYAYSGAENGSYNRGYGLFNNALTTGFMVASKDVSTTAFTPLIGQVLAVGTYTLVDLEGDYVCYYTTDTLTKYGCSPSVHTTFARPMIMAINDMDGDGVQEVITSEEQNGTTHPYKIYIVGYNGTDIVIKNSFLLKGIMTNDGEQIMVSCRAVNDCLAVYTSGGSGNITSLSQNWMFVYAYAFNYSGLKDPDNVAVAVLSTRFDYEAHNSGYNKGLYTFPKIRSMPYADIYGDGNKEYAFTALKLIIGNTTAPVDNTDNAYLVIVNVSATGSITYNAIPNDYLRTLSKPNPNYIDTEPYWGNMISSPVIGEFDNDTTDGLELAYAHTSQDTFNTGIENQPYLFTLDFYMNSGTSLYYTQPANEMIGDYVSNLVVGNYIADSPNTVCMFSSYTNGATQAYLSCSYPYTGGLSTDYQYIYAGNISGITTNNDIYSSQIMSVDESSLHTAYDVRDGGLFDAPEVMTAYGVMQLGSGGTCAGSYVCNLNRSFNSPFSSKDTAIISADPNGVGTEQMYGLSASKLEYYTDGATGGGSFSGNSSALITHLTICPSYGNFGMLQNVYPLGQAITFTMSISDFHSASPVRARVCMYKGEVLENCSNWSNYALQSGAYPSSVIFTQVMNASSLTSSSYYEIQFQSQGAVGYGYVQQNYAVLQNGLIMFPSYTQCFNQDYTQYNVYDSLTNQTYTPLYNVTFGNASTTTITDANGMTVNNNTVTNGLNQLASVLNLGIGLKAIWLFLIVLGIAGIFISAHTWFGAEDYTMAFITACFFTFSMYALGFFLGIFGWGMIILMILCGAMVIAFKFLRPAVTGGG
jgi:hypothetical protein